MKIGYCPMYAERITVRLDLFQQSIRMSRKVFHSLDSVRTAQYARTLFEL